MQEFLNEALYEICKYLIIEFNTDLLKRFYKMSHNKLLQEFSNKLLKDFYQEYLREFQNELTEEWQNVQKLQKKFLEEYRKIFFKIPGRISWVNS